MEICSPDIAILSTSFANIHFKKSSYYGNCGGVRALQETTGSFGLGGERPGPQLQDADGEAAGVNQNALVGAIIGESDSLTVGLVGVGSVTPAFIEVVQMKQQVFTAANRRRFISTENLCAAWCEHTFPLTFSLTVTPKPCRKPQIPSI
jgi:hypothetical protein